MLEGPPWYFEYGWGLHDAHNNGDVPFEYVVFKTNWDPSDGI
ncbi:MAG: hypothetical protein ACRDQZ_21215 [Mycobacteriales bacterium]